GVLPGPGDGLLGGVDVCDLRAGRRADQACDAGVAEQVENFQRPSGGANAGLQPGPVRRLLWKEGQVPEGREPPVEANFAPSQRPCLWRIFRKAPPPGFLVAPGGIENRV